MFRQQDMDLELRLKISKFLKKQASIICRRIVFKQPEVKKLHQQLVTIEQGPQEQQQLTKL